MDSSLGLDKYPVGEMRLTYYIDKGVMRSGAIAFRGAVAVDTDYIPLGSILWLPCFNRYLVALDTGAMVVGPNHLDVYVASEEEGQQMLARCGDRAKVVLLQKP